MSVFGGDSWGREAHYRKRRVDDLLLDSAGDHSTFKKLPSGKYACLICPHNPVLDTPLMLSMHVKAKRHVDAEMRVKQREEEREKEMNKRRAFSLDSTSMSKLGKNTYTSTKQTNLSCKPLSEKKRKAAYEVIHCSNIEQSSASNSQYRCPISESAPCVSNTLRFGESEASGKDALQISLDYRERKERELKFTSAGWKRDGHGGWFRDENVEFDSDEEDPNVSLAFVIGQ